VIRAPAIIIGRIKDSRLQDKKKPLLAVHTLNQTRPGKITDSDEILCRKERCQNIICADEIFHVPLCVFKTNSGRDCRSPTGLSGSAEGADASKSLRQKGQNL